MNTKPTVKEKVVVIACFLVWLLLTAAIAVSMFSQRQYHAATGLIIISLFFLAVILSLFIKPKQTNTNIPEPFLQGNQRQTIHDEDFILLFCSKDYITVIQIKETLETNGIPCIMTDEHSAKMVSFLPNVEIRVLVRGKDFKKSKKIVEDIFQNKT